MIAITGASGNIGRHLTRLLATAGAPARLLARDPAKLGAPSGASEIVAADLDRPETLDAALAGVTDLFLLSPGPTNTPTQDANAIAAAQRAGVRHIVLLSSLGVERGGIGGGRAHAPGEAALMGSGLAWTMLRPSELMTNTLAWLPEAQARGTISVPSGSGKVGIVAPADIAAVAFAALTTPGHAGAIYRLTGPEALTTADMAAHIGGALGKTVTHTDVTDAEFRAYAQAAHVPDAVIAILSEYYAALKAGQMDVLAPDVERVTGRPATSYADWARDAIGAV